MRPASRRTPGKQLTFYKGNGNIICEIWQKRSVAWGFMEAAAGAVVRRHGIDDDGTAGQQ
jgi:hypothetical protein